VNLRNDELADAKNEAQRNLASGAIGMTLVGASRSRWGTVFNNAMLDETAAHFNDP
jgi:hypothetical protein